MFATSPIGHKTGRREPAFFPSRYLKRASWGVPAIVDECIAPFSVCVGARPLTYVRFGGMRYPFVIESYALSANVRATSGFFSWYLSRAPSHERASSGHHLRSQYRPILQHAHHEMFLHYRSTRSSARTSCTPFTSFQRSSNSKARPPMTPT